MRFHLIDVVLSGPFKVGAAVISDLFKPEERGLAVALYSIAPLLGPVVGNILVPSQIHLS